MPGRKVNRNRKTKPGAGPFDDPNANDEEHLFSCAPQKSESKYKSFSKFKGTGGGSGGVKAATKAAELRPNNRL